MPSDTSYDEKLLFKQIAAGDEMAFALIFHRYKSSLFTYAMKVTKSQLAAEELVQDCFLKLWTNRSSLADIENPSAWLHAIARNAGVDYLRRLSADKKMQQKLLASIPGNENATLEKVQFSETRAIIMEAVQQLGGQQQQVFYLSRNEGLSYEEIGARLNISPNTVRNHLVKALKFIREYLAGKYGPVIVLIIMDFLETLSGIR